MRAPRGLQRRGFVLAAVVLTMCFWGRNLAALEVKQTTINYIEVTNDTDSLANRVAAYLTVSADDESPVTDLAPSAFSAMEDGRGVTIENVAPATDPMAVILALDASGSMLARDRRTGQTSMASAREAALQFIDMLGDQDRVAVFGFNHKAKLAADFSDDRSAVRDALASIQAEPNAATCLYDTAYEAIQKAAEIPRGRRAIVLLTDGRDEKGGGVCSTYTAADVIDAATTKSIRVPIFTIGVGPKVDARQLGRMASLTGGRSLLAPSAADLSRFYQTLAAQLKGQYRMAYSTQSASGEHSLVVKVRQGENRFQDEKRFWSPPLPASPPPKIAFVTPADGARIKGTVAVRVGIEPVKHVQRVRYYVDGALKKEFTAPPFDAYDWSTRGLAGGLHVLRVETVDIRGQSASAERTVTVDAPPPPAPAARPEIPKSGTTPWLWIAGLAVLSGLVAAVVVCLVIRRRQGPAAASGESTAAAEPLPDIEDETVFMADDANGLSGAEPVPPATLTVVQSLELEEGTTFPLGSRATVGRTDRNDVNIPDKPVSRKHAEIYFHEGVFFIRDMGSRNGVKVDTKRVFMEGAPLKDGAEIQLGPRTLLRFNCAMPAPASPMAEDAAAVEEAPEDDSTIQNFQADKTLRYGE